jgi:hypothetical protein
MPLRAVSGDPRIFESLDVSPPVYKRRLEEVTSLLTRHSFDFDASRLCPFTQHVVTGNTGFLTPRDLKDFDEAIDAFVNGKFYACGFTAEEIVGKLAVRHVIPPISVLGGVI